MRIKELWLFLFLMGTLAFDWPFLQIFGSNLPVYLFAAWLFLIGMIYLFIRSMTKEEDGG